MLEIASYTTGYPHRLDKYIWLTMEVLTPKQTDWTSTQKDVFRLFTIYAVLYMLFDGFGSLLMRVVPGIGIWDSLVHAVGSQILPDGHVITEKPNGSGDTTYNYVQLVAMLIVSIVGALIWNIVDRDRKEYNRALYIMRNVIRHYLGIIMVLYGLAKVFKTQFPYPSYDMLTRSFGDASPMGLLWTFMGYSYPYNLFTGMGEVVGGALLFARRTTLLGSLVVIGVMSHVVVLNFSYDVPVKIYSTHLLLMAVFLATPHMGRLYSFFIANESVEPASQPDIQLNKNLVILGVMTKVVLLGLVCVFSIMMLFGAFGNNQRQYAEEDVPLYGTYQVEDFQSDAFDALDRWKKLDVTVPGRARVSMFDGSTDNISFNTDSSRGLITVYAYRDSLVSGELTYVQPADSLLELKGMFQGDSISVSLRKVEKEDFLLNSRGFRWINEVPFNR